MPARDERTQRYVDAIRDSGLSIYDPIDMGTSDLWIPTTDLEALLNDGLTGVQLAGLPLRTRSKAVKQRICQILGYPVPSSFRKTKPRFPGQLFDTYVQKSDNFQIWNEEVAPNRRYVIVRVSEDDLISRVKVVTGATLAMLETTGTLTRKYQARVTPGERAAELVTQEDTELLKPLVNADFDPSSVTSPVSHPAAGQLLPLREIFDRLRGLVGIDFADTALPRNGTEARHCTGECVNNLATAITRTMGSFPIYDTSFWK